MICNLFLRMFSTQYLAIGQIFDTFDQLFLIFCKQTKLGYHVRCKPYVRDRTRDLGLYIWIHICQLDRPGAISYANTFHILIC